MDPLSIVLGIAGTVVSNVLTELITGKTKAARRAEIERSVAIALAEQQRELGAHAAEIRQQTLDEVALLIERSPDLTYRDDDIILSRPLRGRVIRGKDYVNTELRKRLENLQDIIISRRQQLGLPITREDALQAREEWIPVIDQPQNPQPQATQESNDARPEWTQTNEHAAAGPWSAEILRMQDRIRRRRSGIDAADDE